MTEFRWNVSADRVPVERLYPGEANKRSPHDHPLRWAHKSEKETTPISAETVLTVIRRAAAEVEFRAALFADPAAALAGYDLSAAERAALTGLTAESFDALAGELEARMSKSACGGETDDPGVRAITPG